MKLFGFTQIKSHNCAQALRYFTCNKSNKNPTNQDSNVSTDPSALSELLQIQRCTPPNPDYELESRGEHNCMLKRLRNGHPVLLNRCFLCGLIVETCSHAVL